MKHLLFIALSAFVIAGNACWSCAVNAESNFRIAGYLPDYRFADLDFESLHGLTDLIIFSAEPNEAGGLDLTRLSSCPWERLLTFKTKRSIRLILTIGGWDRSSHFAQIAQSKENRKVFARTVVQFALNNRLDGIDLDWEHPKGNSEQNAYGELLAELRSAFKPHGLLLSVTVAAWQHLPPTAIESVDIVQIMAYDHNIEHSTMEGAKRDIQTVIDANVPPQKIVLGLPFYGRDIQSRQATTYREIVAKFTLDPKIDQIGQTYFNGPETIRRKVKFALDSQLGGVMVWEVGQDAPGDHSLLKVIRETLSACTE